MVRGFSTLRHRPSLLAPNKAQRKAIAMALKELQSALAQTKQQIEELKRQIIKTEDLKSRTETCAPSEGVAVSPALAS
jgi:ferritin-like metal-binding protein YciE